MEESRSNTHEDCYRRLQALGLEPRDKEHHKCLKRASVLVLLFAQDDGQLHTLITKRSMNLRSHPGECCFPGGRQDEEDENDDTRTALREAQEEIGLDPDHVEILGRLPTMESVNHLCVTSIVGKVRETSVSYQNLLRDYQWKVNRDEVDQAFSVPLAFFLEDPESIYEVKWSRETFYMRTYDYYDKDSNRTYYVTGLTAHIAHEVASIAFEKPSVDRDGKLKRTRATQEEDMKNEHNDNNSLSGYLWKQELSSRGRPYWTKRYFVRSGDATSTALFLHQYDSEKHAQRKAQTATKKNRLPLKDCQVVDSSSLMDASSNALDGQSKYEFVLRALGGRIQWHLAAITREDRDQWIKVINTVN